MDNTSIKALTSSDKQDWETPPQFVKYIEDLLCITFDLDPCASTTNYKAPYSYTVEENGLIQNWFGNVWLNPPYNNVVSWIEKALSQRFRCDYIVMCIPARTDTKWFHELIWPNYQELYFLKHRIRFIDSTNNRKDGCAMFPTMIVIFNHDETRFTRQLVVPKEIRGYVRD
tara:strand:- start:267 stop:779 length:513 start_codon:yes stop_codon:yes gene_type:complete